MVVLDAYGVVAVLAQEPAAREVEETLRVDQTAIPTVNLAEALDVLVRVRGAARSRALQGLRLLFHAGLRPIPTELETAFRAADLRAADYHRTACPVSIADCVLLAHAGPEDRVATSDPHVAALARAEGIGLVPLPDSSGRRP